MAMHMRSIERLESNLRELVPSFSLKELAVVLDVVGEELLRRDEVDATLGLVRAVNVLRERARGLRDAQGS